MLNYFYFIYIYIYIYIEWKARFYYQLKPKNNTTFQKQYSQNSSQIKDITPTKQGKQRS